jgi:UDPglucose 6-dehydrogenase/GDP-mannose 6-dehydrogenase
VLAVRSTVLPGTTGGMVLDRVAAGSGLSAGAGFGLAMNPEFLSQGSAVADFLAPDRIIIGALDRASTDTLMALYQLFDCPKLVTSLVDAELIKYAANAFQATLISFSNQIAGLCEAVPQADANVVMNGLYLDRIVAGLGGDQSPGPSIQRFLKGGVGFGGSCFPKDLAALSIFAKHCGAPTAMLDAVTAINRDRPRRVLSLLRHELGSLVGRRIVVLGLTFKPDTDDLRESPGLALMRLLAGHGALAIGHDPLPSACRHAAAALDTGQVVEDLEDALTGTDAALIATAWPNYAACDWTRLSSLMHYPLLLDGRDLLGASPPGPPLRYIRIGVGPLSPRNHV